MNSNVTSELRDLVDWYVDGWGPVQWAELRKCAKFEPNQELGTMLHALSLIEADSQTQRRKLAATGADRSEELLEFIAIWLAEEGEHGRSLAHLAALYGPIAHDVIGTRAWTRDVRTFVTWPSLYMARTMPGICATYCTLGAMQELVALATYNHLARLCEEPEASELLRAIARQESRHLRFYRNAASIFLENYPRAQRSTRLLLSKLWRPPGMDLFGAGNYEQIFGPILNDPSYANSLLEADRIASRLPGLGQVQVMTRYLKNHGFDTLQPLPVEGGWTSE